MKTTLEIPDVLFREAKMIAARDGTTLRAVITQALELELQRRGLGGVRQQPWRKAFGGMRHLREENAEINRVIEETFEQVDEDAWR